MQGVGRFTGGMRGRLVVMAAGAVLSANAWAQACTTQAKMTAELRSEIADSALFLAAAIQGDDAAKVQSAAVVEFAGNFSESTSLIHRTAAQLVGDTLHVTQVYALDAKTRKVGDATDAEFSCPLTSGAAETDFSIGGLPPGIYGFAMVEATGGKPWLLAMLLRQEGLSWKLAGFYPRSRLAAGRDGVAYWTAARDEVKAGKPWLAWLSYGQADELLRPANFVTSTNLDRLRSERRGAAPKELAEGVGADAPLVLTAGAETFRITSLASAGSDDGAHLNLLVHLLAGAGLDAAKQKARNVSAAAALLSAHRELRSGFESVLVFAEAPNQPVFLTQVKLADVP